MLAKGGVRKIIAEFAEIDKIYAAETFETILKCVFHGSAIHGSISTIRDAYLGRMEDLSAKRMKLLSDFYYQVLDESAETASIEAALKPSTQGDELSSVCTSPPAEEDAGILGLSPSDTSDAITTFSFQI